MRSLLFNCEWGALFVVTVTVTLSLAQTDAAVALFLRLMRASVAGRISAFGLRVFDFFAFIKGGKSF